MSVVKSDLIKELAENYPNFLRKDLIKLFDISIYEMLEALKRGERIDAAIAELNFEKRKVALSIKLLEEIMNAKAIKEHSSPLSGKNLPFSSLSEQLDDKKNKKETE